MILIICSFNLLLSPWVRGSVARSPSSFRQAQIKLESTRCIFRLKIGYHYSSSIIFFGKCWELALFQCNFKSSSSCESDTEALANRRHMPVRKWKTFTWCHAVAHSLLCLCQCRFSAFVEYCSSPGLNTTDWHACRLLCACLPIFNGRSSIQFPSR